jgi:dTDP-glucose 4,6-dehydratase
VRALGWEQTASFEERLAATVRWYGENADWWRPLKSGEYRDYYARQYAHRLGSAPPAVP